MCFGWCFWLLNSGHRVNHLPVLLMKCCRLNPTFFVDHIPTIVACLFSMINPTVSICFYAKSFFSMRSYQNILIFYEFSPHATHTRLRRVPYHQPSLEKRRQGISPGSLVFSSFSGIHWLNPQTCWGNLHDWHKVSILLEKLRSIGKSDAFSWCIPKLPMNPAACRWFGTLSKPLMKTRSRQDNLIKTQKNNAHHKTGMVSR